MSNTSTSEEENIPRYYLLIDTQNSNNLFRVPSCDFTTMFEPIKGVYHIYQFTRVAKENRADDCIGDGYEPDECCYRSRRCNACFNRLYIYMEKCNFNSRASEFSTGNDTFIIEGVFFFRDNSFGEYS